MLAEDIIGGVVGALFLRRSKLNVYVYKICSIVAAVMAKTAAVATKIRCISLGKLILFNIRFYRNNGMTSHAQNPTALFVGKASSALRNEVCLDQFHTSSLTLMPVFSHILRKHILMEYRGD